MCEDGDVEYDMDKLKAANIQVAEIDSEDEFTAAKLNELNMQYLPEQVFIEYNGTWGIDKIIEAELQRAGLSCSRLPQLIPLHLTFI